NGRNHRLVFATDRYRRPEKGGARASVEREQSKLDSQRDPGHNRDDRRRWIAHLREPGGFGLYRTHLARYAKDRGSRAYLPPGGSGEAARIAPRGVLPARALRTRDARAGQRRELSLVP